MESVERWRVNRSSLCALTAKFLLLICLNISSSTATKCAMPANRHLGKEEFRVEERRWRSEIALEFKTQVRFHLLRIEGVHLPIDSHRQCSPLQIALDVRSNLACGQIHQIVD
ncbi:hypothetical protein M0R45_010940 [Rubus argutus]|uniref:Secreted protein n=1 Tax=Rubus argutus TaxID=59490 RepID=A0AAW1Y9B3_RUBAR